MACPACHALVHADELRRLAALAETASARGDTSGALREWREALLLLPQDSQQHATITTRVLALSEAVAKAPRAAAVTSPADARRSWFSRGGGVIIAIGIFALTKAKLLLLGLTKLSTMGSMLLFLLVYLQLYGWAFALGFVLSIYVHEMGHVAALAHFGIPASAPMFIPGLGAVVRLRAHPASAAEDARVGLAGPVWGVATALVCWGVFAWTQAPIWRALAHAGAWINLFNLLPVWQLDGGRGMTALARTQRLALLLAIASAFAVTHDSMFVIVGLGAAWQAFRQAPLEPDWEVFATFVGLIAVLALLLAKTSGALSA